MKGLCRYSRLLFLLMLFLAVSSHVQADSEDRELPENFVRIHSLEELTEGDVFLIGAQEAFNTAGKSLILLTAKANGNWLLGTEVGKASDAEEFLTTDKAEVKWQFEKAENGTFVLRSAATELYAKAVDAGKTHLKLAAEDGTAWQVMCEDGFFYFTHPENSERKLSLYKLEDYRYGNYSSGDEDALRIYRAYSRNDGDGGEWTLPAEGASVALVAQNRAATPTLSSVDAAGLFLRDGTVAQDAAVGRWTYRSRQDGRFVLCDGDGKYLDYDFTVSDQEILWQVRGGKICTCEEMPRTLYCDNAFCLLTEKESNDAAVLANPARLLTFATAPASQFSDGLLTLQGGWSATHLSELTWDGVYGLDLSAISLPVALTDFRHRPDGNTIVYVGPFAVADVPEAWPFVVLREGETGRLLTRTTLKDKCPLRLVADVRYEAGMLSYEREAHADGAWETICLPFAYAVPEEYGAVSCTGADNDSIAFETAAAAEACQPLLIRYKGDAREGGVLLRIEAGDGVLKAADETETGVLCGTMELWEIESEQDVYLLAPDGKSFVRAAAGSVLPPFRACLRLK